MLYVFGHKSPDSDSICAAVTATYWLNQRNRPAKAFRLGEPNRETRFIFEQAGVELPPLLTEPVKDKDVFVVDFPEMEQGPDDLNQANIVGLIDHHRLGSLTSKAPLEAWMMPIGSSSSVLFQLFGFFNITITQPYARLILGALLSDTVGLKSPTTTDTDRQIVDNLLPVAGIQLDGYISGLLKAKTDLSGLSIEELLDKDSKKFELGGKTLTVGQLELADIAQVKALIPALQKTMEQRVITENRDIAALMLTNIRSEQTQLLIAGPKSHLLAETKEGELVFEHCLSRKKQILPWLTEVLTK
ncbi:putative manganese-dependent inorganic pyrophosphatase [invertebrate metagenome]|uniref:inorganic diphosphatase n=1 Tax=invertebrate metagenome TaxID=1711999 RepID=A0A2H9T2D2_9ZZZZ